MSALNCLSRSDTMAVVLRALLRCLALALLLTSGGGTALAQSVALTGLMGAKALLVVDAGEPKALGPGETHRGVKLVSTQADSAVLEIGGKRQTVRIGEAPVSVGTPAPEATGARIVLSASSDGHFVTQGMVNSRPVQFLVDTGATTIGIGVADAERIGLKYKQGQAVHVATANGTAQGWKIQLSSVRLNDIEVRDITAVVTPFAMPFVLLGNSFLTRFQMTRTNDQMVLEKRF
jgi:aspartyl protease family protein